ncbi:WD40 repeat domain-containing protein [Bacillus safensis]|uniref:WD40 repeat domain-containing protein n=1 Tax=Bacillus safensis TaxID=561879 RepID=UPI002E212A22|nr:WD40 repeat domain-containing protein [Bacillus safensis]
MAKKIRITVVDLENRNIKTQFDRDGDELEYFGESAITNDGHIIIPSTYSIQYCDENGNTIRVIHPPYLVKSIAISPLNNHELAVGDQKGYIQIWDLKKGQPTSLRWKADESGITSIVFNQTDGSRLMSTSSEGNIQVWDARNGEAIGPRFQGADLNLAPAISFDGKKLAYSKKLDRPIEVYEVDSGRQIVSIPSPQGQNLTKMMFDQDNQEILASYIQTPLLECLQYGESQIDTIRWSADTGGRIGEIYEGKIGYNFYHNSHPSSIGDNWFVSTQTESAVVLIWDKTTSRTVHQVKLSPEDTGDNSHISPDGKLLLVQTRKFQLEDKEVNKHTLLDKLQSSNTISKLLTSSNLGEVTNELLSSAKVEAPVCVGISEYCIADGIAMGLYNKIDSRYPIETQEELYYGVTPSHHVPMEVFVDVSKKKIRVNVDLFLDIYKGSGTTEHRISRTRVSFKILADPHMAVGRSDVTPYFQLKLDESMLEPGMDTRIIHPESVIEHFGTNEVLIQFLEKTIENMMVGTGKGISQYFSSLVLEAPMTNSWNRSEGYELIFRRFEYRSVTVDTDAGSEVVGYLLPLFTLVSHDFPPPCICKEDITFPPRMKTTIPDARRWISLAFSETALNVLATPHRRSGGKSRKSKGGSLYASIENYFKTEIGDIQVVRNGIGAPVNVGGGGSLTAGLRDPILKNTIIKETVGYSISIMDAHTEWSINVLSDSPSEGQSSVMLIPTVYIDPQKIDVQLETPLPRELNQILSWLIDWFVTVVVVLVVAAIQHIAFMRLMVDVFQFDERVDNYRIMNVHDITYPRSSIVIVAEVSACSSSGLHD